MKWALVTGSAHRLGRAMANSLHAQGYNLLLHYHRSSDACLALADNLNQQRPDSAKALRADLSSASEAESLAQNILEHHDQLHALINNASLFQRDEDMTEQQIASLFQCNLHSPATLMSRLQPALNRAAGSVVNLVDIYADHPLPGYQHYCASKAGLASLTRSQALNMAPTVRVNGISPGAMLWATGQKESRDYREALLAQIPLKRLGGKDAICQALHFLLDCDYMTGQLIRVDGGRSLTI